MVVKRRRLSLFRTLTETLLFHLSTKAALTYDPREHVLGISCLSWTVERPMYVGLGAVRDDECLCVCVCVCVEMKRKRPKCKSDGQIDAIIARKNVH